MLQLQLIQRLIQIRENIINMACHLIDAAMDRHCNAEDSKEWDISELTKYLENLCIRHGKIEELRGLIKDEDREGFIEALKNDARSLYEERETMLAELGVDMREFERVMLLRSVDVRWMDHIDAMDQLRDGIGFRAYSGKNPVTEYQIEAGYMFDELNHLIREDTVRRIYQVRIEKTPERIQTVKATQEGKAAIAARAGGGVQQPRRVSAAQKVGRNDPCPCGSGKKYKACCGKNQPTEG